MPSDRDEFFAKAQEGLLAAEAALDAGWFTVCARTAYFAAYHAAIAALLHEGIVDRKNEWGHDFVQAAFAERLITRRKVYPSSLRATLKDGMALRHAADYEAAPIRRQQLLPIIRRIRELVEQVDHQLRAGEGG
ncbi:MAG: HEPN domain-containing protein [Chloroflexi bacterium]|nr:HEPN domain-containing protein [Chloroflexota bacterium]